MSRKSSRVERKLPNNQTNKVIEHLKIENHCNIPDSITTFGQRWQTVVPLAASWRLVQNKGPTLG